MNVCPPWKKILNLNSSGKQNLNLNSSGKQKSK